MRAQDLVQMIGAAQGSFLFAMTIAILYHYLHLSKTERSLQKHIITIALSYNLLTFGTEITLLREIYPIGDLWMWVVFTAYTLGDYAMLVMFRRIIRRHAAKKLLDEIKKNNKIP